MIFGACDVELLQAEHQLGFVFLLHPPSHNSPVALPTLSVQFSLLRSGAPHSLNFVVVCSRPQMLPLQAEHLLLRTSFSFLLSDMRSPALAPLFIVLSIHQEVSVLSPYLILFFECLFNLCVGLECVSPIIIHVAL